MARNMRVIEAATLQGLCPVLMMAPMRPWRWSPLPSPLPPHFISLYLRLH